MIMTTMNKQVCILLSITVVVPVVFSCCIPDKWQGIQGIALASDKGGKPSITEALFNISLDATGKKIFLTGSVNGDGKDITETVLQDFPNGNQYVVVDGKCTMSKLTTPFPPSCVQADAKKVLSTFFGAGKDKIMIDVYSYTKDGKESEFTVTKEACIPVTAYQKTDDSVLDINYFGITPGIMNMSVFDVPKPCMHPVQVSPKMHHMDHRPAGVFV